MHFKIDEATHSAIFGPRDDLGVTTPGRSRHCKTCGGWHRLDRPWPHNCRPPAPARNRNLATPQIAPKFEPFKTGVLDGAAVISNRYEKSEYMKRNDLVEHETGVGDRNGWVEDYETEREIVADLKRFHETDPENLPPDLKAQRMDEAGSLDDGSEINASDIEVVK